MMKKSIATCKLYKFKKQLEHLNKRLAKLGKPLLTYTETGKRICQVTFQIHEKGDAYRNDRFRNELVEFTDITIEGLEFFKKDDIEYTYIGSVNYKGGVKTVYCTDDEKYLQYFKEDRNVCDHCHTVRRRNGYNLFMGDGKVLWIGSNCSRDFFGYDVDKMLDIYLNTLEVIGGYDDDPDLMEYRGSIAYGFDRIYAIVREATKEFSYWEKSDPYDGSGSSNFVRNVLFDPAKHQINYGNVPENAFQMVKEYWENQEESSSFTINMRESLKHDYCVDKNIGAYAFAIYSAIKALKHESQKSEQNDSQYKEGDRPEISGIATYVNSFETEYGYKNYQTVYVIEILGDDGVYYFLKSSANGMYRIKVGSKVKIKGTILGRNDFLDKKRWQLIRCKFISCEEKETTPEQPGPNPLDLI